MKKPNLSQIVAVAAIAIGLATASAGIMHAASSNGQSGPMGDLVAAIAKKFNLNQADVQQVFDEQHAQMEAQMQQRQKDRLSQAVTDGKLTQEQMDKILAKQQELQAQHEADKDVFANLTEEERHANMKERMNALQQWAKDNNIPQQFLMFTFKGSGHGGPGRGMFHIRLNDDGRGNARDMIIDSRSSSSQQ